LNGKEELAGKAVPCDNRKYIGFFNEIEDVYITNLSITMV
jgi:hypothetical protein